jgi:hypothetical protein
MCVCVRRMTPMAPPPALLRLFVHRDPGRAVRPSQGTGRPTYECHADHPQVPPDPFYPIRPERAVRP